VVEQPGEGVRAGHGARVLVGVGVAAGDDRELGDRLERAELLLADVAKVAEADAQRPAKAAVPAHRHADLGVHPRGAVAADGLAQLVEHDRPAGRENLPGDALAGIQPMPEPAVRGLVAGGRDAAAADLVHEVDLGDAPADREVGLARERL
jgi:hypothetical protein